MFGNAAAGVRTSPAFSGYVIDRNLFRKNTVAIRMGANGAHETVVSDNAFGNDRAGSTGAWGILRAGSFTSPSNVVNVTIERNLFTRYEWHMIDIQGGSDIRIRENLFRDNGPNSATVLERIDGLDFAFNRNLNTREVFPTLLDGRIHDNEFLATPNLGGVTFPGRPNGVEVLNPNPELLIDNNVFERRGAGVQVGNQLSAGLRIENNIARKNEIGIYVNGAFGTVIRGNTVTHSGGLLGGIELESSGGLVVEANVSSHNAFDGISVIGNPFSGVPPGSMLVDNQTDSNGRMGIDLRSTSDNMVRSNQMHDNAALDAYDDNRAANTWLDNLCLTDFPPGTICTTGLR